MIAFKKEVIAWLCGCSVQSSSVAQSCPTLCDPMNHSTPGLPVHHQLPEFTQTHVHRVGDAIQSSHPLSSPSPPAPNPSQHQSLFQWVNSSHAVAKVLEFQLQHHSLQRNPRADLLQNGLVSSPWQKDADPRMILSRANPSFSHLTFQHIWNMVDSWGLWKSHNFTFPVSLGRYWNASVYLLPKPRGNLASQMELSTLIEVITWDVPAFTGRREYVTSWLMGEWSFNVQGGNQERFLNWNPSLKPSVAQTVAQRSSLTCLSLQVSC